MQGGRHPHPHPHPHPHHLHQQLAALVSAALPSQKPAVEASPPPSPPAAAAAGENKKAAAAGDDADRAAALDSLHRAILYPPNSFLLPHSAPLLSQPLSQLLSDKSYAVRRAAAIAYGSLCAVLLNSAPHSSPPGSLPDRFVSWALPLLGGASAGANANANANADGSSVELALEGLAALLDVADAGPGPAERLVPPVLKACQELLEDDRTSLTSLPRLLRLLTLIAVKFGGCFRPHFVDTVDLLLGWAFVPNLSESDRRVIMDSFTQFRRHWVDNLRFSVGLLAKFLGDMEVLIHDAGLEAGRSLDRSLALFSCFFTVLQVTASAALEMDATIERMVDPLLDMAPRLLRCIAMFGAEFGRSKWAVDSQRCLLLLAEILREKFAEFYEMASDTLFRSSRGSSSFQAQALLKTNLQLLSLQNTGLLPSSVRAVLQFRSSLSQLRLHPNQLVAANSAATYLFFLKHGSDVVVAQAIASLLEELELLKAMLAKLHLLRNDLAALSLDIARGGDRLKSEVGPGAVYSESELLSLMRFDLKVLLAPVSLDAAKNLPEQDILDTCRYERASRVASAILEKLNPFDAPFHHCPELQFHIFRTLHKLSEVELLCRCTLSETSSERARAAVDGQSRGSHESKNLKHNIIVKYTAKYGVFIVGALKVSSPLTVKLEALDWIRTFSSVVLRVKKSADVLDNFCDAFGDCFVDSDILNSVLDSAYDRESKVRSHVATSLEALFQARLINPGSYPFISQVALDKIGDPDKSVRDAFVRVMSVILPVTVYSCGLLEDGGNASKLITSNTANKCYMNWRHVLAVEKHQRTIHSHQLVSILSYISHRWKVPLSSWVQRLVFSSHSKGDTFSGQRESVGDVGANYLPPDMKLEEEVLDKMCPVNNLAAVWWCIHEAARYCINLRLRTNLGGPTQTFAALERMLIDIPNVLTLDVKQGDSMYIWSSDIHLLPMRLLLEFVEVLKKNVYNAYEGSFVLPSPAKQSSLFFRANKKVCEEWFSRISEPMLNAGLALHCDDAVLHYCVLRLVDLKILLGSSFKDKRVTLEDILRVLRHASLAFCRCHESDALVGLQKWAAITFSSIIAEDGQHSPAVSGSLENFSWMTGLVYQARGQYEKAAAHYSHLLQSEEALVSMGSDGIQFIIARVIECYTWLSDWKCLESWLTELQKLRATHAGKAYSGALTAAGNELNAIHALARFDDGDFHAAWGYLDLTPKSSSELTLDPKVAQERSEQMLLRSMLQGEGSVEELDKAKLMLDEALSVAPLDGLTDATAYAVQLHCIFAFEEGTRYYDQQEANQSALFSDPLRYQQLYSPINRIQQDCSLWMKAFRVYRTVNPSSLETLFLCQRILTLARKQSNFMLANRMIQYLTNHPLTCPQEMYKELLDLNMQYESILLKHAEGKGEEALTDLWTFVRPNVLSATTNASDAGTLLKAKACLKLSTWLGQVSSNINSSTILSKICEDYSAYDAHDGISHAKSKPSSSDSGLVSNSNYNAALQEIVGTAIKASCYICPTMGKSWLAYASWCFSQAKNSLPLHPLSTISPTLQPEISSESYHLTKEELSKVESIINKIYHGDKHAQSLGGVGTTSFESNISPEREMLVNSLVEHAAHLIESAAGAPGFESYDVEGPSAALSSQLLVLLHTNGAVEKDIVFPLVDELIRIWWLLRRRRVSLFGNAAHGYFQYLSHSSSKLQASPSHDVLEGKTRSCTLRAVLHILHIILNYGVELKETLEFGLSTVPLFPWQEIIPQLFARLSSHPEKEVRKQLEGILMMLGKLSPCSIVYPTLVDLSAYDGEPSEELQRILDHLVKLYPKLIQDVKLAIEELGMITVLWEEQWLSTLQDLHSDVIRRLNMLKEETARVAANPTLTLAEKNMINTAKYSAMMAPIVVALERRMASTSREPRTAHETWFHKEYSEQLKSAILGLKTPTASATALADLWRPFEAIAASLSTHHRKSFISLSEVAPQLARISTSDIPMPGFEKQVSKIVTISSFCDQVMILSTKTKPKKLVLMGSDGQKYTYLLKGREDLRLDARIMQLLEAVNSFLYSSGDAYSRSLAIRYYSVTPISGRAGLIQWVNNATSVYSVYKSWQKRTQLAQLSAVGAINLNNPLPPVPRPSDMFYGKIIPALKEKGIKRVISRRDWPLEVKRKVLFELMKETPRQLLWQEMWCASEGFKSFNLKTKRFSGSVAAMSMMGHILGLGDRHLDNILMDFYSGEVVHIDYNICFDKGKKLKIPEIVPFRLTQTIEAALGLTGIEGTFRANCETVMTVLQKNKDIILMLLEVFVWDPLIEWTRGNNQDEAVIAGEEKKGMELAVSLSLFSSRVQEIRVPLQEHHDLLLSTLPAAESALKGFLDVLNQYEIISAIFYHADKEVSSLMQLETSAKSIVAEATSIVEKCQASRELHTHGFAQAKAVAAEEAQELALWVDQHARVLDALRDGALPGAQKQPSSSKEALSLTSAVLVSGIPLTIVPEPTQAQCYDMDKEIFHLMTELENGLCTGIEALHEYALALQRVLPINYMATSAVSGWAQVLQLSVNSLSVDVLALAKRRAVDLVAKAQGEGLDLVRQRHQDLLYKMDSYIEEIKKLDSKCSELVNSIGSDNEAQSRELLLSSFMKYMQPSGHSKNGDDIEEKRENILFILGMAMSELYRHVMANVIALSNKSTGTGSGGHQPDLVTSFHEFDEQIEKCVLIMGFAREVEEATGKCLPSTTADNMRFVSGNWVTTFQAILQSGTHLIEQMTEVVLPEIIRSVISHNSEVMEAFGSLSHLRGSIDTALERIVQVELERASLVELEKSYFVKVGAITEQQIALEEAAVKGRDHLSWEEAEELASQEEACRAQLDQLHQSWSERDMRTSSLSKIEASVMNSLVSSEQYFASLISIEQEGDSYMTRSKALLATLTKPFADMESVDLLLSSYSSLRQSLNEANFNLADLVSSGSSSLELVWALASLLKNHSFFIWKVIAVDSVLDLCMHEISSLVDHNFSFDQLYNSLRKKLMMHIRGQIRRYFKERVAPALISQLDKENDYLQRVVEKRREPASDQLKRDLAAARKVQVMLEEYCNAHETARAARAAVSLMERQVNELTEALGKTILEIVQLEWLHDLSLPYSLANKVLSQNMFGENKFFAFLLNLSRTELLEKIQTSMSSISRTVECLQAFERASMSAEEQLERAMGWATGSSGIPSEFHDHLLRRRQLLWAAREQATDIVKICSTVMEFEASRDGLFWMPGEKSSGLTASKGRAWQQAYLNSLTRLDAAHHSFTRAEQEWNLAQHNMETAANGLFSATNQLHIASVKAKSASVDLHDTLATMHERACQASAALSAYCLVSKGRTALTSECGTMLDEVLAITEGLHDVYTLGKQAASAHSALMTDLSKANMILLRLETSLSTDLVAIANGKLEERDSNAEISLHHGKALYESYIFSLRETCQALTPLVPSITYNTKELHFMLNKLAQISSLHARNLHKALEGLGGSQMVRSQEDLSLSRSELLQGATLFSSEDKESAERKECGTQESNTAGGEFSVQDDGWISPPEHTYTSSSGSITTLTESSFSENSEKVERLLHETNAGFSSGYPDGEESTYAANSRIIGDHSGNSTTAEPPDEQALSLLNEAIVKDTVEETKLLSRENAEFVKQVKGHASSTDNLNRPSDSANRAMRGKNAFALSVLKQVEQKLHGRDIEGTRSLKISEQVDHLLKQATSIDNLCNMYEGWTPWI